MIIGHQSILRILERSIKKDSFSHAYLFAGPEKVGKRTIAKEFAKLLLASHSSTKIGKECHCRSCQDIEKGIHPDFLEIKAKEKEIGIKQIRDLRRYLSLSCHHGRAKVSVIDKAEKMTKEASNALLKTLEEPKGRTVLILVTSLPNFLLATIVSRCQIIKFLGVSSFLIEESLLKLGAEKKLAREISKISQGKPGKALEFFSNPEKLKEEKKQMEEIISLSQRDLVKRFEVVEKISQNPSQIKNFLSLWKIWFRDLFLVKLGIEELTYSNLEINKDKILRQFSLFDLMRIIKLTEDIDYFISFTNVNPRLALEVLMLNAK